MPKVTKMTATMVFVFIRNCRALSQRPPTGNKVDQNHDNGYDQEDVNKPAHRVTGDKAGQPQDD
jgi:hypothetical protein